MPLVICYSKSPLEYSPLFLVFQGLPQVLLPRMLNVKDVLLIPALAAGDESIISGVASLMAELGQAVRIHILFLN